MNMMNIDVERIFRFYSADSCFCINVYVESFWVTVIKSGYKKVSKFLV